MAEKKGGVLDELIATARAAGLVDEVRKRGRGVYISVGGEQFTLSTECAETFLATLLRIGRSAPSPVAVGGTRGRIG